MTIIVLGSNSFAGSCFVNYSLNKGKIWKHGDESVNRNNFYGIQYDSSIKFLMNEAPNSVKRFKTLNYSGTESKEYVYSISGDLRKFSLAQIQAGNLNPTSRDTTKGWYCNNIATNLQNGSVKEFLDKEGKYFNYIKGSVTKASELDSREFSMQGVGNPSSITGDLQVDYNLNLTIDPSCITSSFTASSTTRPVEEGTNLNTLSDSFITITPAQGFNLDSTQITVGTNPEINSYTFTQDGDNILMTVNWANYTMPASELTVEVCVGGNFATEQEFTLNPTLRITETGEVTPSSQDITLTPVSGIAGYSLQVDSRAITITSGSENQYYFQETPFIFVNTGDALNYTFASSNETYTNGLLTGITFTTTYEFPSNDSTDIIEIVANSVLIGQEPISYSFFKRDVSCAGETIALTVTGSPGATLVVEASNSNSTFEGGASNWSITMPSSGTISNDVTFAAQSSPFTDEVFNFTFKDTIGGTVLDLIQPNPIVRNQNCLNPVPPVITRIGRATIDIFRNDTYTDQGATATDSVDGDITSSIVTVNPVNTATIGTYIVTYNVTNSAGTPAAQVTRTVIVKPPQALISSTSTASPDCSLASTEVCFVDTFTDGVVSTGDTVYGADGVTPFVGDGNYFAVTLSSNNIKYPAQINSSGVVTNSGTICI